MTGSIHSAHMLYSSKPQDYQHQDIGFLEVVVAVRAVSSAFVQALGVEEAGVKDDYMHREERRALATDVVTLSGFSSVGAASEAVEAIAEWCTRWGHQHGLITSSRFPAGLGPGVEDKATSTEEPGEEVEPPPCAEMLSGRPLAEATSVGTGSLWCSRSEGGHSHSLLLHRDSFDLSNPSVRSAARKHSGRNSKLWTFIHRGSDKEEEGEVSDDDADLAKWQRVSEARDTILLQNRTESKGSAPQPVARGKSFLPFAGFISKTEAIKVLPRGRSATGRGPVALNVSSRWETRSFTPPKERVADSSCGKYHHFVDNPIGLSKEKDGSKGWSPRSAGDRRSPIPLKMDRSCSRSVSAGAKPALLEILERAATGRNSNVNVCGFVEQNA
mmetsp:Transcript_128711/g.236095  ORF Transcript_128711/g.236095 Transcript_128711/m.236095 type:complete len:386 (-) Transcript_128711:53-1210(-)